MTTFSEGVKKKIDDELRLYFPKMFDDALVKEYYDKLRKRTLLMLDTILEGESSKKLREIDTLTDELIRFFNPQNFVGEDSVEIKHDKQFEEMCIILAKEQNIEPKKLSVLGFYCAYESLIIIMKEREKHYKA